MFMLVTLTKVLAANQGLYNRLLAAGLLRGLWLGSAKDRLYSFFSFALRSQVFLVERVQQKKFYTSKHYLR